MYKTPTLNACIWLAEVSNKAANNLSTPEMLRVCVWDFCVCKKGVCAQGREIERASETGVGTRTSYGVRVTTLWHHKQWAESQTGSVTGENAVSNHRAADCCCAFFVNEEPNWGFKGDVAARSALWMVASPWHQALQLMGIVVRCTLQRPSWGCLSFHSCFRGDRFIPLKWTMMAKPGYCCRDDILTDHKLGNSM